MRRSQPRRYAIFVTKCGSAGTGDGEFAGPIGITVDGTGTFSSPTRTTSASRSSTTPEHFLLSEVALAARTDSSTSPLTLLQTGTATSSSSTETTTASRSSTTTAPSSPSGAAQAAGTDSSTASASPWIRLGRSSSPTCSTTASRRSRAPEGPRAQTHDPAHSASPPPRDERAIAVRLEQMAQRMQLAVAVRLHTLTREEVTGIGR